MSSMPDGVVHRGGRAPAPAPAPAPEARRAIEDVVAADGPRIVATLIGACGDRPADPESRPAEERPASATADAPAATGTVIEIKAITDEKGNRFEPETTYRIEFMNAMFTDIAGGEGTIDLGDDGGDPPTANVLCFTTGEEA